MSQITEVEIIEKAKELGKLLKDSDIVKEYNLAKTAYEQNSEIQDLLGKFNIHKMSMTMLAKQENPDEEKIECHEKQIEEIYAKIMESSLMVDFQEKSQRVETIIGNINSILNLYITGDSTSGCSGSCSTCGGCSGK